MQAILYRSRAFNRLADPDARELLATTSATRNASAEISGFMLYREGHFMQYIEGEQGPLNALFAKICADSRHEVRAHISESIQTRRFPNWRMKLDPEDYMDALALESLWNMLAATAVGQSPEGAWSTLDTYAQYAGLKLQA